MTEDRVSFGSGVDRDAAAARAAGIFQRDGVVVLDDVVDPALIEQCRREIEVDYPEYDQVDPERNFGSFPGRHTTPLRVGKTLADRAIFAPRAAMRILPQLLGDKFVLDSFGLLVSLPGADDQQRHADMTLFPDKGIDWMLPPFAIALAMPLVPMDEVSGTTAFWRRSHRAAQAPDGPYDYAPILQPGSAMLWDFRVLHGGLANRSDRARPVIFSVFCREWWREWVDPTAKRYEKLMLSRAVYDGLGERMRLVAGHAKVLEAAEPELAS